MCFFSYIFHCFNIIISYHSDVSLPCDGVCDTVDLSCQLQSVSCSSAAVFIIMMLIKSKQVSLFGNSVFVDFIDLTVKFVVQTKRRSYVERFHLPMRRNPLRSCRPDQPQDSCSSSPDSSQSSPAPDNVCTISLD